MYFLSKHKYLDSWQKWTMLYIYESIDIKIIVIGYFGKTVHFV